MYKVAIASEVNRNFLLSSLTNPELEHLLPHLQPIELTVCTAVSEAREPIHHCYCPTSSVISLLYTMPDGMSAGMGLVGKEGVLGVSLFLGGESACSRAVVAVAGDAFRLSAMRLRQLFAQPGPLQRLLLLYTLAYITQVSQTAVCNRLHSAEQRLCRLLLLCDDRANRSELPMTQELIATMLGGRRESVTVAAGKLQDAGLIRYCRGRITILDRDGLESAACECYRIVEDESDHLFNRQRTESGKPTAGLEQAS
jgi:CRP-like cAMP-binding protein